MLVDLTFFTMALTVAVQIVAIIEALKNFIKDCSWSIPAWGYTIISAVLALGLSLITIPSWEWAYISERLLVALFAFCLAELFYDSIWKWIKNKLDGKTECIH